MKSCRLCPRNCGVPRESAGAGVCRSGERMRIARAALHFWEEPPISGARGSGAVFFTGCPLGCVFCQNGQISRGPVSGREVTPQELSGIFFDLIGQGAHNINLVTPTHFVPQVRQALQVKKLPVPVVYNTSGYEKVETLRSLEGLVDIYLPDYKYDGPDLAKQLSHAEDYPQAARAAIREMVRQVGPPVYGEDGLMKRGVLIRHLILPGQTDSAKDVIDYVAEHFEKGSVLFSLMAQYIPCGDAVRYPEINRRLTQEEYDEVAQYLMDSPIENGFFQELESAEEEYVPNFDLGGVLPPEER